MEAKVIDSPGPELIKVLSEIKETVVNSDKERKDQIDGLKTMQEDLRVELANVKRTAVFPSAIPAMFDGTQKSYEKWVIQRKIDNGIPMAQNYKDLQELNDTLIFLQEHAMIARGRGEEVPPMEEWDTYKYWKQLMDVTFPGVKLKSLDTQTAGEGLEWVPTLMSTNLLTFIMLQLRVAAQHPQLTIPRGTGAFDWPFVAARSKVTVVPEQLSYVDPYASIADADRSFGAGEPTAKVTFDPRKVRWLEFYTREWDEDTIAATLQWLLTQAGQGIGDAYETSIINGDEAAAQDANISANDPETWYDGLRLYALGLAASAGTFDFSAAAPTEDGMRDQRKKMGKYGVRLSQLRYYVSLDFYFDMLKFPKMQTLADLGPNAFLVTGQVGAFDSIPVIISEFWFDLNNLGVNDGIADNFTGNLLTHVERWIVGRKPGLGTETERLKITDNNLIVAFERADLQQVDVATATSVNFGFNVPL